MSSDASSVSDDGMGAPEQAVPVAYKESGSAFARMPWREVDVSLPSELQHAGMGFLEVLPPDSYDIVKLANGGLVIKARAPPSSTETVSIPKKTLRTQAAPATAPCSAMDESAEPTVRQKRARVEVEDTGAAAPAVRKRAKGKDGKATAAALGPLVKGGLTVADILPEWLSMGLHPALLSNLARLGYARPTRVQLASIPPALAHYKDVVGAAETGSGKTAAYALPILHRLLERRERLGMGTVKPGVVVPLLDESGAAVVGEEVPVPEEGGGAGGKGRGGGGAAPTKWEYRRWQHVAALILAPTRELAVQVRDHIAALCSGTCISVVAVVGGLAPAKQDRLLRSHPDIIVATPGRLWDMASSGEHACLSITGLSSGLQFLVLDEADRLTEKGSFAAVTSLLASMAKQGKEGKEEYGVDEEAERIIAERRKKGSLAAQTAEDVEEDVDMGGEGGPDDGDGSGDETEGGGKVAHKLKGSLPARLLVPPPGHYKRQTLLFSATLGVATAQTAKDAASALVQSQIASGALTGGSSTKLGKKAYRKALAKAATLTPVEALMARVGVIGKTEVVRVKGRTAAGAAVASSSFVMPGDAARGVKGDKDTMDESGEGGGEEGGSGEDDDDGAREGEEGEEGTSNAAGKTGSDALRAAIPASVALPRGLRLARMTVNTDGRDPALVYFLARHQGRTLVFVNAINTLRRLSALLASLRLPVHTLHAHMQQKQRLAHLEAFRCNATGILVATDVAARGLDIPAVQHVLHYALPQTAETFVHRCGRTARGEATGLSVALVGPTDQRQYMRLCSLLNLTAGLSEFPVEPRFLKLITARVSLARKIADDQSALNRDAADAGWLAETASAAGLIVDERSASEAGAGIAEMVDGGRRRGGGKHRGGGRHSSRDKQGGEEDGSDEEDEAGMDGAEAAGLVLDGDARAEAAESANARRQRIKALRYELDALLAVPLLPTGTSHKYITANPEFGQQAHPLQAMVKVVASSADDGGSPSGGGGGPGAGPARRAGSALVAPRVELPQDVLAGLRAEPGRPSMGPGKLTNKKIRQARALSIAASGGAQTSALSVLAAKVVHAHIPGISKGRLHKAGKQGLQNRKGGRE